MHVLLVCIVFVGKHDLKFQRFHVFVRNVSHLLSMFSIIPWYTNSSIPGMYFTRSASYSPVSINLLILWTFSDALRKLEVLLSTDED